MLHLSDDDDCWSFKRERIRRRRRRIGNRSIFCSEMIDFHIIWLLVSERNKVSNQLTYWTSCEYELGHRTGCEVLDEKNSSINNRKSS